MDETKKIQSTLERCRPTVPDVVAVLDRHRDEIAEAWALLALETMGLPELMDFAERKARAIRVLEAMCEALRTGSHEAIDQEVSESTVDLARRRIDIGNLVLTWVQVRAAAMDVLQRAYPADANLILDCITQLDHCLNYCVALSSKKYSAEINRHLLLQHARTQLMLDVGRAASSTLDLDQVLAHTAKTISKALGLPNCVLMAVDEERKQVLFRRAGSIGISRDVLDTGQSALHGDVSFDKLSDFSLQLLKHKKPVIVAGAEHDPRFHGYQGFFVGAESALGLPLIVNDRVVALAWARVYDGNHIFSTEEIELAQGIADVAALGIDNARLYGEAARLARMEERQRMARELHDTVAQMSFSIGLHAQQALEDVTLTDMTRSHLSIIERLAARSGFELRSAIFALEHLESEDKTELGGLLRKLVDDFQSGTGIRATIILPGELPALPSTMSTHIFRVVRESLSNVQKHAHASAVLISLRCDDHSIAVSVQDDGVGVPDRLTLEHVEDTLHFGLAAMRHIAQEAEGEFTITNSDDGGTLVQVRLPLTAEQNL